MNLDLFASLEPEPEKPAAKPGPASAPAIIRNDLEACKYCQAWFLPLTYLAWRMEGYCCEAHAKKAKEAK